LDNFSNCINLSVLHIININSYNLGTFTITLPLTVLFVARSLDRITGGNISVANAYLVNITTGINRSKILANYQYYLILGLSLAQH
jgi:DHA1 family tetracycline resistance protein-like MFS transporter